MADLMSLPSLFQGLFVGFEPVCEHESKVGNQTQGEVGKVYGRILEKGGMDLF